MSGLRMTLDQLSPRYQEQVKRKFAEQAPAPRACATCKKDFVPKRLGGRHKGIYCSFECMNLAGTELRACITCQQKFRAAQNKKQEHCSQRCARRRLSGALNPAWRGGKIVQACHVCGKEQSVFPSRALKTCSAACRAELRRRLKEFAGENNPNWRGSTVTKLCAGCGHEFKCKRGGVSIYCSRECFNVSEFSDRAAKRWSTMWGAKWKKAGKRADLGGQFFRSGWEANYARYLNFRQQRGEIAKWEYEAETFEFAEIRRGVRFYTPDFKVTLLTGAIEFHEVKGWRHKKGETALRRMKKYYPGVTVKIINKEIYLGLRRTLAKLLPGWET